MGGACTDSVPGTWRRRGWLATTCRMVHDAGGGRRLNLESQAIRRRGSTTRRSRRRPERWVSSPSRRKGPMRLRCEATGRVSTPPQQSSWPRRGPVDEVEREGPCHRGDLDDVVGLMLGRADLLRSFAHEVGLHAGLARARKSVPCRWAARVSSIFRVERAGYRSSTLRLRGAGLRLGNLAGRPRSAGGSRRVHGLPDRLGDLAVCQQHVACLLSALPQRAPAERKERA
jgi:hypothetical protein